MEPLDSDVEACVRLAIDRLISFTGKLGISLDVRRNFEIYAAIRYANGDMHLNQAFDPKETRFGDDDFWLLAENHKSEPIATYCVRRLRVRDFSVLIQSQCLWF